MLAKLLHALLFHHGHHPYHHHWDIHHHQMQCCVLVYFCTVVRLCIRMYLLVYQVHHDHHHMYCCVHLCICVPTHRVSALTQYVAAHTLHTLQNQIPRQTSSHKSNHTKNSLKLSQQIAEITQIAFFKVLSDSSHTQEPNRTKQKWNKTNIQQISDISTTFLCFSLPCLIQTLDMLW